LETNQFEGWVLEDFRLEKASPACRGGFTMNTALARESALSGPTRSLPWRLFRGLLAIGVVFLLLPYVLTPLYSFIDPPSTPMLWRYLTDQRVERTFAPLSAISPALPATVIAAEDARFCAHSGVDWEGLRQALREAEDQEDLRGGSTITMQTAKNLFLWPGRSYVRKALEFPLSLWIDLILSKRRVMEIYLNIAEWGPEGEFGAEAGARHAFGKPARALTGREAALMAAILPNPIVRSAGRPGPAVRRLAGIYQHRATQSGPLAACLKGLPRAPSP
jgi:monofunctional biosynthetic peptidoglycan transglycosylase